MPAVHTLILRTPLPASVPPAAVLAQLHQHTAVIRAQPLVTAWDPIPVPLSSLVDDPFFLADADRIAAYRISERVAVVGPVTAPIAFPAVFQNGPGGLRIRADAPCGVRLWAEYVLRRRGSGPLEGTAHGGTGEWSDEDEGRGEGDWEMVEVLRLQGNRMLMPLMKGQMRDAHWDICRKIIKDVVAERADRHAGKEGSEQPRTEQ